MCICVVVSHLLWALRTEPGPLQEQKALLAAEPSVRSQCVRVCCVPPTPTSDCVLTEVGLLCYKQNVEYIQGRPE